MLRVKLVSVKNSVSDGQEIRIEENEQEIEEETVSDIEREVNDTEEDILEETISDLGSQNSQVSQDWEIDCREISSNGIRESYDLSFMTRVLECLV